MDYEEIFEAYLYFSTDQINNSPSRKDGISSSQEAKLQANYCALIRKICQKQKINPLIMSKAMILCHRFYQLASHHHHSWKITAVACIAQALKGANKPCQLDDMIDIAYNMRIIAKVLHKYIFDGKRKLVEEAQRKLLDTLHNCTTVRLAYTPLQDLVIKLRITSDTETEARKFIDHWLDTTVCIQYRPECIALGTLYITNIFRDYKLGHKSLSDWSNILDILPENLNACIRHMAGNLVEEKWPGHNKLNEAIAKLPALKQPVVSRDSTQASSSRKRRLPSDEACKRALGCKKARPGRP